MVEIFPAQPFIEKYEFYGTLRNASFAADHLHVMIEYPVHKQGEISGKVLGDTTTFNKIASLTRNGVLDLTFESLKENENSIDIFSASVRLIEMGHRSIFTDRVGMSTHVVSSLDFDDISVKHHLERSSKTESHRRITFFLAGPRLFWQVHPIHDWSTDGEGKLEWRNKDIVLGEGMPFQLEVRPQILTSEKPSPEGYSLSTEMMTICLTTKLDQDELDDKSFVADAQKTVDDLLLLASFASRAWIVWFRYRLETSDLVEDFVRRTRNSSPGELSHRHTLVEAMEGRAYLGSAFPRLRDLRSRGTDLSLPIVLYISGNAASYAEEQFTSFFFSLEQLKDMYLRSTPSKGKILEESEFSPLRENLSTVIHQNIADPVHRARIYEKLAELNRPALRTVLQEMMNDNEIDWSGLYPPGASPTLIKSRNILFHSAAEAEFDSFVMELHRLKALLERFLLAALGWRDFSRSPDEWERKWLTNPKQ